MLRRQFSKRSSSSFSLLPVSSTSTPSLVFSSLNYCNMNSMMRSYSNNHQSMMKQSASSQQFCQKRFASSSSASSASNNNTNNKKVKEEDSAFEDEEEARESEQLTPEEREAKEDKEALRRYIKYGLLVIGCTIGSFFANDYAKKTVGFKEKDSTYVHVNTRGRPSLGGPFVLANCDGEVVSQADFLGQWVFFYFGFVHCPEICPIELNRMTKVVDMVKEKRPDDKLQPLFVSCDVKRDSLSAIREYLSIFHKDFIGLVGTPNQVNQTCKSYRIYYSLPDDEGEQSGDYLIDHSIAIFLFDPQGRFVDFFGSRYDHHEITAKVVDYMGKYEQDPEWTNY